MVTFNQLLKKVVAVSLFSLTLVPNAHGMFSWMTGFPGEWDVEALNQTLHNQNYEEVFKFARYHMNKEAKVADWLEAAAYNKLHVPCMYEQLKLSISKHYSVAPNTEDLKNMLAWMVVSLVLAKADTDCCRSLSHASSNQSPFDLFMQSYAYELSCCSWDYKETSCADVLSMAKAFLDATKPADLQGPVWVCTVKNTAWTGVTINFGASAYDQECRKQLRATYGRPQLLEAVDNIRAESFKSIWQLLDTVTNWTEFFKIQHETFSSFMDQSNQDLTKSIMMTRDAVDAVADKLEQMKLDDENINMDIQLLDEPVEEVSALEESSSDSSEEAPVAEPYTSSGSDSEGSESSAIDMAPLFEDVPSFDGEALGSTEGE